MKVFICLSLFVACVSASGLIAAPAVAHVGAVSTGHSSSSRTQDAAGNYAFAYDEQHATGGSSRKESGSPGVAVGAYTLNVADGRQRVVKYVADGLGFRAAIATNEPGTAAQPAAATSISSPYLPPAPVAPLAVAAPVAVAAPIAHAPVLAAPIAHAPVAVAHAVPAVSSYSTSVNHATLAAPAIGHVGVGYGLGHGLGLGLKGHY